MLPTFRLPTFLTAHSSYQSSSFKDREAWLVTAPFECSLLKIMSVYDIASMITNDDWCCIIKLSAVCKVLKQALQDITALCFFPTSVRYSDYKPLELVLQRFNSLVHVQLHLSAKLSFDMRALAGPPGDNTRLPYLKTLSLTVDETSWARRTGTLLYIANIADVLRFSKLTHLTLTTYLRCLTVFSGFKDLIALNLHDSILRCQPPIVFWPKLTTLNLSGTNIANAFNIRAPELLHLDLRSTYITDFTFLRSMLCLQSLKLCPHRAKPEGWVLDLELLPYLNMTTLVLQHMSLLRPLKLSRMVGMEHLDLNCSQLFKDQLAYNNCMPELKMCRHLTSLPNLKSVCLAHTQCTDIWLLKSHMSLKFVHDPSVDDASCPELCFF